MPCDATDDDIRRAYKKLALLHHPDKCGGDDTLFKKINAAYQILTDPAKRAAYDAQAAYSQHAFNIDPHTFKRFLSIIISFLYRKQEPQPAQKSMVLTINASLDELYHAKIKKIVVRVSRDGVFKSVPLYISLLNYQSEYVFKGMGDEKKSDIVVKLIIEDHPLFKIDNLITRYDMYIERDISLYEYYMGLQYEINSIDNKKLFIEKRDFASGSMVHVIKGAGLPYSTDGNQLTRGDLLVFFRLVLPKKEPKKIRRVLKKYFSNKNV